MNRAFPCSLYTHLFPRSRALSTHPKRRGDGGYPPLFGAFLRGGSSDMRPLLTHHKKASLSQSTQTDLSCDVLEMVWPFSFDWCLLCARELVRSVIRTPCCRALVHKACLYASLAISPSRPTPTCPHCQQDLGLAHFRRLCWRLSGKWSPWFECPPRPCFLLTLILTMGFTYRSWIHGCHHHRLPPVLPTTTIG